MCVWHRSTAKLSAACDYLRVDGSTQTPSFRLSIDEHILWCASGAALGSVQGQYQALLMTAMGCGQPRPRHAVHVMRCIFGPAGSDRPSSQGQYIVVSVGATSRGLQSTPSGCAQRVWLCATWALPIVHEPERAPGTLQRLCAQLLSTMHRPSNPLRLH